MGRPKRKTPDNTAERPSSVSKRQKKDKADDGAEANPPPQPAPLPPPVPDPVTEELAANLAKRITELEEKRADAERQWGLLAEMTAARQAYLVFAKSLEDKLKSKDKFTKVVVGGRLIVVNFTATPRLAKSRLARILGSGQFVPDANGEYFLDRDPEYFDTVINWLQGDSTDIKSTLDAGLLSLELAFIVRADKFASPSPGLKGVYKVQKQEVRHTKASCAQLLNSGQKAAETALGVLTLRYKSKLERLQILGTTGQSLTEAAKGRVDFFIRGQFLSTLRINLQRSPRLRQLVAAGDPDFKANGRQCYLLDHPPTHMEVLFNFLRLGSWPKWDDTTRYKTLTALQGFHDSAIVPPAAAAAAPPPASPKPSASPSTSSTQSPAGEQYITLLVCGADSSSMRFTIRQSAPMVTIMKVYCFSKSIDRNSTRFWHDGTPVRESDTPLSLQLEENDQIDALPQQQGD